MATPERSHGAVLLDDASTRFALWAPSSRAVALELASGETHALQQRADGWFSATLPCAAGTAYRFIIEGHLHVPDPASRAQVDGVHGWSQVVDPRRYAWRNPDWPGRPWHETILYEVHVGLLGGFLGVEACLPTLVELGVTAIELMPLGEFPGERNWGYDGVLPFAPHRRYGTPDELRGLIDSAHGLGLMVFVDVVYNHFGPDGNYLHEYARAFFREDVHTPWGAAIDFRRPQVRDFFCENALMWLLDYHVDGLRLDAAHAINDNPFLIELAQRARAAVAGDRHIHLVLENERNDADLLRQGFDAQWNDDGHNVLHHLLTGEQEGYYAEFAKDATAKLASFVGEGFIHQGQSDRHGEPRGQPSAHLPPSAFVLFLQNHDQVGNRALGERLASLVAPQALRAASVLLLLGPMIPLLFMGEEWGSRQPFLFFTDHHAELGAAVREGRRAEFAEFSAFADPQAREAIPDPNALATFSASLPDHDPGNHPEHRTWRAFYRHLLHLRQAQIVPRLVGARALGVEVFGAKAISASWRLGDGSLLRIDLNLSDTTRPVNPPEAHATLLFGQAIHTHQGQLPPYSAVALLQDAA
ncbi:malto-oligosyltrehalose trehalohydrolase [Pseudomonas sp. LRF_L74]|uniref:malto-oligosyltrehalose trehalohydrolase n=1 Tax=Pseudomonas sp. LRF_L74 TaxID=3369422 RepID=UPI003F60D7C5